MVEICHATIKGISVYSPSRAVTEETKRRGEMDDAFDLRIWRFKAHVNADGKVIQPFMGYKKALDTAGKLTPRKIAGRGAQTYSNQIISGVLLTEPLVLNMTREDMRFEPFMCSPTGDRRGLGKRVVRRFPMIDEWGGVMKYYVTNPTIQKDILEEYIRESGMYVGIGRFRPEVGGVNGRFIVEKFEWATA